MATSRRRERELARRRFERRRQAELERRARARRRNTIIGAVSGTVVVVAAIVILAVWAAGGFSSGKHNKGVKALSSHKTASPSPSSTPPPAAPTRCATISPNPPTKGAPKFPAVKGKLKSQLVVKDLKAGHGRAAQKGDTVSVYYTGISCDTGKVFDSSYLHQPLAPFPVAPLGTASVIPGWNQGLIGVKAGGTRELIIPASLAYGAGGSPPTIKGNDTLDFVVQVKSVKK